MNSGRIAALLLFAATSSLTVNAQQAGGLQLNVPYRCENGMSLTVAGCALESGKESCLIQIHQNGKLAFQGVAPRERVVPAVQQCEKQAAASRAQGAAKPASNGRSKSLNPSYLSEMPSVDQVLQGMKAGDSHETALRQIWAFYELIEVIKTLSGDREFSRNGFLPDETKIIGEYQVAQYKVSQEADKAFPNNKPSEDLTYHFSRWDPKFGFKGINIWQFFSESLQSQFTQIVAKDNARYAAMRAEQRRIAAQGVSADPQVSNQASGSPFVRNDPGTLAARRCVELGGNALECVGKGFFSGLMDMVGVDPKAVTGSQFTGVLMNGRYLGSGGLALDFGAGTLSLNGCGKLVPNGHAYTITKKPNQLLISVRSEPTPFVLAMGSDGRLSGPGPIDVNGQIITGYDRVWMQRYHNGIAVAGEGYWDSRPVYAAKTERCNIGSLAQAPPPAPDTNPLTATITSAISTIIPQGPAGLRMSGQYAGLGGLALEFGVDSVVMDCGAAHVKQAYSVENTANQLVVNVKNGGSPFMLALQPNGTLTGSGTSDIAGRVVTGSTENAFTYAAKNARCAIGTLAPKGGTATAQTTQ